MRFVIVLEEVLKFSLVEDDNGIIDDGDLVVVGDFKGDFGRERFETFTIKLPRRAAFKGGGGGNGFSNVENFCAAFVTRVGEASDDAFYFLEFVKVVAHGIDIAILMFDEVDESFGAADVAEVSMVDNLVFAVGFFIFATFKTFVGLFYNIASSFLHEEGFNASSKLFGVADAIRCVIFVEKEEFDGDVVFNFVNFVCPMKNIEGIFRSGGR